MTLHERINRRCGDLTWCQVSTIQGETRLDEIDGRLLCRLPPVSQQRLELFVVGGTHQHVTKHFGQPGHRFRRQVHTLCGIRPPLTEGAEKVEDRKSTRLNSSH